MYANFIDSEINFMLRNVGVCNVQMFHDSDSGYRNTTRVVTESTSWQLDMEPCQQRTTLTPEAANSSTLPVTRQQEAYSTWTLWISGNFWAQFSTSGSVTDDRKWTEDVYRWKLKLSLKRMKRAENWSCLWTKFEFRTPVSMNTVVLWYVTECSLVQGFNCNIQVFE